MPLHAWLIFCTAFLARVAFGVQSVSVGAVGPVLIGSLDLSYVALGTLVGVYSLPATAVAFPSGWLAARFGDRNMLICGLALMTAGGALMTVASGYSFLLAGRLIAGSGTALMMVVASKLVLDHVPAALMAMLMGTFIAGFGLGYALGQSLLPLLGGWRAAMGACALLCALSLAATALTVPRTASSGIATEEFRLRPGTLVPLLLMSGVWALVNASFIAFYAFLPTYFVDNGRTLVQAGGLSSLGLYACLVPMPFGGWLLSRSVGLERGTLWSLVGITVCFAMLPLGVEPAVVVVASGLCIGLGAGPAYSIATRDLKPEERALAMGIFTTIFNAAVTVGPAIAGWARDITRQPEMPFYVAVVFAGLAVLAQAMHGYWRRPNTASASA